MSQRKAVHVSLLGIDGAGKTSVANALAHYVREKGRDAHIVSWKHVIPVPGYVPGVTLSSISMAAGINSGFVIEPFQSSDVTFW